MHKAISEMDTNGGNRKKELPSVQAQRKRVTIYMHHFIHTIISQQKQHHPNSILLCESISG